MGAEVAFPQLPSLQLEESQPPIYDQPIHLKLLFRDAVSGAEHYVVRYPVGLKATRHRHTAAHTVIVIDGEIVANGRTLGPGSYCHFPAGVPMHHEPAEGSHCLFVTIFDGPFDVEAV